MTYDNFEPTINPIIARLKAQAGIKVDTGIEEEAHSDSRFSILNAKARAELKASFADDSAEAVKIDVTDIIPHSGDNNPVSSDRVSKAKLNPTAVEYATPKIDLSPQGLLPGKANVQSGIYKLTFEDGCYILGYAGDLYAKMVGVVSRINRNQIPRYPRGTAVISLDVVSNLKEDLKQIRIDAHADPKYITKLQRIKSKKSKTISVVEKYKARKAGNAAAKAKTNPVLEAHREEKIKSGGKSALERLRAKGGMIKPVITTTSNIVTKEVSMEIAEEALAELDAAFDDLI